MVSLALLLGGSVAEPGSHHRAAAAILRAAPAPTVGEWQRMTCFFILIVGSIYDKIIYFGERFLKPKNMTFKVSKSELIPAVKT